MKYSNGDVGTKIGYSSDETDSGLMMISMRCVANGVNKLKSDKNAVVVITHYQRLLRPYRSRFRTRSTMVKLFKTGGGTSS
jgi:Fe-S cluster assembly ATP-binding protein